MASPASSARRVRVRVEGIVQGVGFRPHVYRLAERARARRLRAQRRARRGARRSRATRDRSSVSCERLRAEAPPLAAIDTLEAEAVEPSGEREFRIVASRSAGAADALVSPDTATCAECLAEVLDPADRRYRYPFTNCTNCGPGFTIVRGVPYDRPLTTMAGFEMCAECRREYEDPRDRRFHAQPNACPECGPRARLIGAEGEAIELAGADAIELAARLLAEGRVVAVKGIGGYHLACRADDVARWRGCASASIATTSRSRCSCATSRLRGSWSSSAPPSRSCSRAASARS